MNHLILYFVLSFFLIQSNNGSYACISTERTALLAFKSKLKDPRNLLSTWKGQNCCSWEGVTCNNHSGHVLKLDLHYPNIDNSPLSDLSLSGKIDPSLLSLRNLSYLDLSGNTFSETEIPNFIGQFKNLVYFNISSTGFLGGFPAEIGNSKSLRIIDISNTHISIPPELGNISTLSFLSLRSDGINIENYLSHKKVVENFEWISKLSSLQHLDLTNIDLSSFTNWFYVVNKLKYLKVLILSGCNLQYIPAYVTTLNFTSLTTLDLSSNLFQSPVPSWFGNFTSLSYLDLSSDYRNQGFHSLNNGFWSKSKEPICQLKYLDLSGINITRDITYFLREFACSWKIIEFLSLANTNIHGNLPANWLIEMSCLEHLDLHQNSIDGVLPPKTAKLTMLNYLDLSSNNLEGVVTQNHLENLTQLQVLDLSLNMIKIAIDNHWFPKFQLTVLAMRSCDVGPMFPSWLRFQTNISVLILQNASINDALPPWFWRPSYIYIDLSHNYLSGNLSQIDQQSPKLNALLLASNNLGGPIKLLPNDLTIFDISNNKFSGTLLGVSSQSQLISFSIKNNLFTGEIPSSICQMIYLGALDLSMDKFSGMIPNCLMTSNLSLEVLDMSFNNLSGYIPNSICSMGDLKSLVLHGNALTGELPAGLQYCQYLQFIDLGNNKLTGIVPSWIAVSLQDLTYLNLRENNFSGKIPFELALLQKLQVLDIASNNLEGSIPDSFKYFNAMASNSNPGHSVKYSVGIDRSEVPFEEEYNYLSTLAVITKGEVLEYSKNLYLVKSIDLSDNNLSGSIPNGIIALEALENLNLSRNNLNGKVPEKIGNIKSLESLDLSFTSFLVKFPRACQN